MKGGFLILLYLARDTLHRWLMRLSSPLARVLVVFSLSLCGLVYLSSYVISIKALRERINRSGGGLIVAAEVVTDRHPVHGFGRYLLPSSLGDYTLHVYYEAFAPVRVGQGVSTLVELPPDKAALLPLRARKGLLVLPEHATEQRLPVEVVVSGYRLQASTLPESEAGELRRLWPGGAVLAPAGCLPDVWRQGFIRKYALLVHQMDEAHVGQWETVLRLLSRMEKRNMTIISSASLLGELRTLERVQYRMRVWVTIGISMIINLLMTSVSSLEYRQNQYVYALLGSFGVSRPLLFLSFVAENTVLVAAGFAIALTVLYGALQYMTETLYRTPGLYMSLWELEDDIRTFCLAFVICILVSAIPIMVALGRPIGKILK